jgi:hypothetical protein
LKKAACLAVPLSFNAVHGRTVQASRKIKKIQKREDRKHDHNTHQTPVSSIQQGPNKSNMGVFHKIVHTVPLLLASCFFLGSNVVAAEAFVMAPVSGKGLGSIDAFHRQISKDFNAVAVPRSMETTSLASSVRGGEADNSKPFFKKPLIREMLAEFIGTFLIVQLGTGSVMSAIFTDSLVGLFQIASVWIIAVTVAICTTASISGAHLNPAVSLAFALIRPSKEFNWRKVLPYSFAQLVGAIAASAVNLCLYSSSIAAYESANGIVRATSSGLASAKAFGEYFG